MLLQRGGACQNLGDNIISSASTRKHWPHTFPQLVNGGIGRFGSDIKQDADWL